MKWIGIDGCRGGWCHVWLDSNGSHGSGILKTIDELTALPDSADVLVLIDMPIGLKESGLHERQCDRAAKGSDHARRAMEYTVSLLNGANFIGTYSCQGEVNPKVLEKASQKHSPPPGRFFASCSSMNRLTCSLG
ncbi:MAG: DUF429 domain-containing protein [Desulfotignum sp.]|nr:DUF429 domain-containing protein [Desulfotignum sp.]